MTAIEKAAKEFGFVKRCGYWCKRGFEFELEHERGILWAYHYGLIHNVATHVRGKLGGKMGSARQVFENLHALVAYLETLQDSGKRQGNEITIAIAFSPVRFEVFAVDTTTGDSIDFCA